MFDRQALGMAVVCAVGAPVAWALGLPGWFVGLLAVCAVVAMGLAWAAGHREGNGGQE